MISTLFPLKLLANNDADFDLPLAQLLNPLGDFLDATADDGKPITTAKQTTNSDEDGTYIGEDSLYDFESSFLSLDSNDERPRRVTFSDQPDNVVLIPSFREYTEDERQNIWSSYDEVEMNKGLNILEYQYEGWNWQSVIEEDQFIMLTDGNSVHPARVHEYLRRLEAEKQEQARQQRRKERRLAKKNGGTKKKTKSDREGRSSSSNSSQKSRRSRDDQRRGQLSRRNSFTTGSQQWLPPTNAKRSLTRFGDT